MKKILCLLLCAAFLACSDEDNIPVPKPVITEETVLERGNEIYDIKIPGDADWTVTQNPLWATPMNLTGEAGTPMELFVETNDDDADRRDSIVVTLSNGGKVSLPLRQHGLASSDENDDAIYMSATDLLKKTKGVGCGIDVIAPMTGVISEKYNIKETPFNLGALQQVIDSMGWNDAIVEESVYSSRYETVTGNTTGAIGNQLSINAGIEVGIKAFKFGVEAGYSSSSQSNSQTYYAMQELQHIVASRYFRAGLMRYLARHKLLFSNGSEMPNIFASKFSQKIVILEDPKSSEKEKKDAMKFLVEKYGTHIVSHGTLGGEMKVSMQMTVDAENSASNIYAALSLSAKLVEAKGKVSMNTNETSAKNKTTLSLRTYGGDGQWSINPGATFDGFQREVSDKTKLDAWVRTIKDGTTLALIDVRTIPIWDLMPTDELRDMLRNYVMIDYQKKWYGDNFKPDLYRVSGFDVKGEAPGCGSIYLPEIELQIDMERTIVPDLSTDELSTVIYSGPKDSVNYDRGFFVGSPTRKPCKFRREKNDKFTTEEFDRLDTNNIIDVLFVDVSGDITIASKCADGLYQDCKVANWKHDLKVLTSDWTCKDDITVEGTTDHCIHIADGTTLTLDNVTVNNQIVCDGNATLVLKDGTNNTVSQGIVNGPEGSTLTICGSGSLTATGKNYYPGIGNGKGDIVISGGTIKAKGSKGGAGIGSGKGGACGNITIKSSVTYVEATCDRVETNCYAIGQGENGTCGKVTIEDKSKVKQNNPNPLKINLDELTCDFELPETKCTLFGTTDYAITIPDGLQVELAGATINNQVTCEGNDTIIITENSHNMIYGKGRGRYSDAPSYALLNGPAGTTLVIDGKGDLFCNVFYDGKPSIGGGEGNILIKGGGIESIGGKGAAGIGSALGGKVGNITISGGDVYCTGSAALGAGQNGRCGNILIQNCKLRARGFNGGSTIGSGAGGSCGNIVIKRGAEVHCELYTYGNAYIGAAEGGSCGSVTIENGATITKEQNPRYQ